MYVENKLIIYFASYMTCHNGIHTYTHAYIYGPISEKLQTAVVCVFGLFCSKSAH